MQVAIDVVMTILVAVVALIPIPATAANVYLWATARLDRGNWVLRDFALAATVINVGAFWFGFLALRRILGGEAVDWSPPISAFLFVVFEMIPIYFALQFRRYRQRAYRRRASDLGVR